MYTVQAVHHRSTLKITLLLAENAHMAVQHVEDQLVPQQLQMLKRVTASHNDSMQKIYMPCEYRTAAACRNSTSWMQLGQPMLICAVTDAANPHLGYLLDPLSAGQLLQLEALNRGFGRLPAFADCCTKVPLQCNKLY